MSERVDSLYICPWSLRDPLCQSQSLAYLRGLVALGYKFALITFETSQHRLDEEWAEAERRKLAAEGIRWYPVDWPSGSSISQKLSGIRSVVRQGIRVCRRDRPRLIHSRSSLPVFAAVLLKKLFRTKFLYDADSMLSQEYLDTGHITSESSAYKFLAWSEKWARDNADHVIVLTNKLRRIYQEDLGIKVSVDVIPCCVDTEKFRFDVDERINRRRQIGITEDTCLLVYVGKVGPRYLVDVVFKLYQDLRLDYESFLLILSADDSNKFRSYANSASVPDDAYLVVRAPPSEVSGWLSAADLGLAFIRPSRAELGGSPIKIAEYLAAGLPVVTNKGIGDVSDLVAQENLGVVIGDMYIEAGGAAVREFMIDRASSLKREIASAAEVFSLEGVGIKRYSQIYDRLIDKRD